MSRYARRTDDNQREIVDALEAHGAQVLSLASVGNGCPDLAVWHRGQWSLLEIKRDRKARLTTSQEKWHQRFPGAATVVRSVEQALEAVGLRTPDFGCPVCASGSLEHPERCECRCHLRNRSGE